MAHELNNVRVRDALASRSEAIGVLRWSVAGLLAFLKIDDEIGSGDA